MEKVCPFEVPGTPSVVGFAFGRGSQGVGPCPRPDRSGKFWSSQLGCLFIRFSHQFSRESDAFEGYVERMRIKISGHAQLAGTLSGGNQQKVVLAKWFQRNADRDHLRRTDSGNRVGAKFEIYQLIHGLAEEGKAILMISSELPEILGMSDRIIVMNEGRVTGEIEDCSTATQEDVMKLATQREEVAA